MIIATGSSDAKLLAAREQGAQHTLCVAPGAQGLSDAVKVRQSPHPRMVAHLRFRDGREVTLTSA